jgi:hypothetical protein
MSRRHRCQGERRAYLLTVFCLADGLVCIVPKSLGTVTTVLRHLYTRQTLRLDIDLGDVQLTLLIFWITSR